MNEMKLQRESLHAILGTATSDLPWTSHQANQEEPLPEALVNV
jgi:hypothetical protein